MMQGFFVDKLTFIVNNNDSHLVMLEFTMSSDRFTVSPLAPQKTYRFEPTWWHIGLSATAILVLPLALAALLV
ncbi:hypothetical protein PAEH1_11910 [Paenalcaligenes hominis]|uniref:Uncharacterized protein n=2 Tax=Paenalcaligenes hominis TaxID=643674 RepID=A0A1U9K1Z8_9BURK|nr:hypothetical protein PAEH1_11910 [Paenalcaligenes hominis]